MSKIKKTDEQWREELSEEQYLVLRAKATEPPFSGNLVHSDEPGVYSCVACGNELFRSNSSYESTQRGLEGWPSFSEVVDSGAIELEDDYSFGMHRIEVSCANCGSHIGHYFDDDSSPTGKHYCANGISLDFKPKQADDKS
jgi:peptide-methionine (R)-S-oxide reductase